MKNKQPVKLAGFAKDYERILWAKFHFLSGYPFNSLIYRLAVSDCEIFFHHFSFRVLRILAKVYFFSLSQRFRTVSLRSIFIFYSIEWLVRNQADILLNLRCLTWPDSITGLNKYFYVSKRMVRKTFFFTFQLNYFGWIFCSTFVFP